MSTPATRFDLSALASKVAQAMEMEAELQIHTRLHPDDRADQGGIMATASMKLAAALIIKQVDRIMERSDYGQRDLLHSVTMETVALFAAGVAAHVADRLDEVGHPSADLRTIANEMSNLAELTRRSRS